MAETTFESAIKTVYKTEQQLFELLSDFTKIAPYMPVDKIENWQASPVSCSFTIPKLGDGGLEIVNAEPNKVIKYKGLGKLPFSFFFWIQIKEVGPYTTKMKLTLKAELNMMMKMALKKQLQEGIDMMGDQMATLLNAIRL